MIVQMSLLLILSSLLCNNNNHYYASGFVGNLLQSSSSSIRQYENGMINNRCSYESVSSIRGRVASCYESPPPSTYTTLITALSSSPLDDFLDNIFGNINNKDENQNDDTIKGNKVNNTNDDVDENEETMSISSFQEELSKRRKNEVESDTPDDGSGSTNSNSNTKGSEKEEEENENEFDGYAFRDAIYNKYGKCFDVDFQRVDVGGFRNIYLNIMPFRLGGKRFRHETEYDYLCHLQAVVEILVKYNQLDYVLVQLDETTKKPRENTSPLIAVPLRLDLTPEQVDKILG